MGSHWRLRAILPVVVLLFSALAPLAAGAFHSENYGNAPFHDVWARTDDPVYYGQVNRTWMWGPEPFTPLLSEPYSEGSHGERIVQYYDKTRMEITDPYAPRDDAWFVTNGLLARELVTGEMQVGHNDFLSLWPSEVPVAGDGDDPNGPTYASFSQTLHLQDSQQSATLSMGIDRAGNLYSDQRFANYGVGTSAFAPDTGHWIAAPFWDFMNSSGVILDDFSNYVSGNLFESPYYATGLPITGAYWANVKVAGTQTDVLIQVFERRVLTYTPTNSPDWRVEAGNVGLHYFNWRYLEVGEPVLGPILADTGAMNITYILPVTFDNQDAIGEYVRIFNNDIGPINLEGWTLTDSDGNAMVFPEVIVWPGQSVAVHVCDSGFGNGDHTIYWGACYEIWDNTGEAAYLFDAAGRLMSEYIYTN